MMQIMCCRSRGFVGNTENWLHTTTSHFEDDDDDNKNQQIIFVPREIL